MDTKPLEENPGSSLLAQLPADVVASFTPEQRAALWDLSHAPSWHRYPVNLRIGIPWFGRRFFITVVAGPDRRNPERAARERILNPLMTLPNVLFMISAGAFVAAAAIFMLFLLQFLGTR